MTQPELTAKLAEFLRWAVQDHAWEGYDLDGHEIEEKARDLGLIEEVKYDPDIHGEAKIDIEPGDTYDILTAEVRAALPKPDMEEPPPMLKKP